MSKLKDVIINAIEAGETFQDFIMKEPPSPGVSFYTFTWLTSFVVTEAMAQERQRYLGLPPEGYSFLKFETAKTELGEFYETKWQCFDTCE